MDQKDVTIQPSIPLPSADLINYRFDQTDKKFVEMGNKLDVILTQTAHFVSEDRVRQIIAEAQRPIDDTLNNYRWFFRALFTGIIALIIALVGIWLRK